MNTSSAEQLSRQDWAYAHVTEEIFKKLDTFAPEQLEAAQTLGLLMAEERRRGFRKITEESQRNGLRGR